MAGEQWDFYEITFSMADADGQIDAALKVYEAVEKMSGVAGASFSGGDYGDGHPFSRADVNRAAHALWEASHGVVPVNFYRKMAEIVLVAATNPSPASRELRAQGEET